jgi:demethylmenaquinone methyltransferase/2-methoxy-6-polyprenyl-1,4-benzoquinol methylase
MTGRFVLKIGDCLEDAEKKKYYNERVFSDIAPRYEFITRALSFGRDAAWKRTLVSLLPSHESPVCVDLACGTGDLAFPNPSTSSPVDTPCGMHRTSEQLSTKSAVF